ncbi:MAG: histidine kinase [Bacteroidia bacterium]|nr:histidine kinase [Bacteroidia bacterium]
MKQVKNIFLLWALFLFTYLGRANTLDSLLELSKKETNTKLQCDYYLTYLGKLSSIERDSALQLVQESISIYQAENFTYGLGRALSVEAWFLLYKAKYEESIKFGHEALAIQKDILDTFGMALSLNRIGLANMRFKRFADAEKYIKEAMHWFEVLKDSSKIDMALNNLGVLYYSQEKFDLAIVYYQQSLKIREQQKLPFYIAHGLYNIGDAFLLKKQLDSAEIYLVKSHQTFLNQTAEKAAPSYLEYGLAQLYLEKKKYPLAMHYAQNGLASATKLDHTEMILVGKELLAELLYREKKYPQAYEILRDYLELKLEIDSANNASNVATIEERYKNAEKEAEIAKLEAHKLEADNQIQRLRLYIVSIAAGLILLLLSALYFWLRKKQNTRIEQSDLLAKIAEAKMFALRAQMNPHFVFNCINTAQNFVINKQTEQAFDYLANFAKLLRLVLGNSAKLFIPLEDELNQIKLYVELEAIRFVKKFTYQIELDPALENGVYEIPGMLLQPLVENAIGHGLINREDDLGVLRISLKLHQENILVEIEDNGVGRKRAAEIQSSKELRYTSAAIPNIKERLVMLKGSSNVSIQMRIIDLEENGIATGTKVVLEIPYQ